MHTPILDNIVETIDNLNSSNKENTMKAIDTYELSLPTWAIGPVYYGEPCEAPEDQQALESFYASMEELKRSLGASSWNIALDQGEHSEPYFTHSPEFGIACDCESATVYFFE